MPGRRALDYLSMAAAGEPNCFYTAFIRFKVLLVKGDAAAATEQATAMMTCEEFHPDFLKASGPGIMWL
jgi:hypothetical protein